MIEMKFPNLRRWIDLQRTRYAIRNLNARLRADAGFPESEDDIGGLYDSLERYRSKWRR